MDNASEERRKKLNAETARSMRTTGVILGFWVGVYIACKLFFKL